MKTIEKFMGTIESVRGRFLFFFFLFREMFPQISVRPLIPSRSLVVAICILRRNVSCDRLKIETSGGRPPVDGLSHEAVRVAPTTGIPNFFERESFLRGEEGNAPRHPTDLPGPGTSKWNPESSIEGDSYEIVRDCSSHFAGLRPSTPLRSSYPQALSRDWFS